MSTILAVDVGGTKLAAARVEDDGSVLARASRPTPTGDGESVVAALLEAVHEVRGGDEVACGVGSGGPMTGGGETVSPLNIAGWRGFPLRARLIAELGLPVHVDNDAKALALGEGWIGAAAGSATSSPWSCPRGSAAGSCSMAASSTAPTATPGTSAT